VLVEHSPTALYPQLAYLFDFFATAPPPGSKPGCPPIFGYNVDPGLTDVLQELAPAVEHRNGLVYVIAVGRANLDSACWQPCSGTDPPPPSGLLPLKLAVPDLEFS